MELLSIQKFPSDLKIKDKNITLTKVFQHETHIEVQATLDYTPPKCCHCQGKQIKYDF